MHEGPHMEDKKPNVKYLVTPEHSVNFKCDHKLINPIENNSQIS